MKKSKLKVSPSNGLYSCRDAHMLVPPVCNARRSDSSQDEGNAAAARLSIRGVPITAAGWHCAWSPKFFRHLRQENGSALREDNQWWDEAIADLSKWTICDSDLEQGDRRTTQETQAKGRRKESRKEGKIDQRARKTANHERIKFDLARGREDAGFEASWGSGFDEASLGRRSVVRSCKETRSCNCAEEASEEGTSADRDDPDR